MNRSIIIFIMCVFCLSLTTAIPIQILPDTLAVNVTKGINKIVTLEINNPNAYTLYDIIAEGDIVVTSQTLNSLEGNENVSFQITLNANEKGSYDKTINIVGFTRLNCSALDTQTHDIEITSGGANPRNIEICRNDNIKFTNNYGSSVYLDIDDFDLYQGINNGDSHVELFAGLGQTVYRIEPLIDLGYVTTTDEFSSVHSSSDDGTLTLHIECVLEETTVSLEYPKVSFNMSYDEIKSGYFIIKNTGSKIAEQINIVGDWFSFDKNNFNLAIDEEKAINFVISPLVEDTSDTDKWYNKTIYVGGDNIDTLTQNIDIFLEYSDVAGGNLSSPEWWIKRKAFCDAYPSSPDCLTEPYIIYRDKKIYDAPPILMNMSPQDVKQYLDEINGLRNEWLTYDNQWKLDSSIIKDGISNVNSITNLLRKGFCFFKIA